MKLYNIDETDVVSSVENYIATGTSIVGKVEVVEEKLKEKYGFPLKAVFTIEEEQSLVVTTYPLKGRKKR